MDAPVPGATAVAAFGPSQVMVMPMSLVLTGLDAIQAMHRLHPDLCDAPCPGIPDRDAPYGWG